jgi:hypothetical protein
MLILILACAEDSPYDIDIKVSSSEEDTPFEHEPPPEEPSSEPDAEPASEPDPPDPTEEPEPEGPRSEEYLSEDSAFDLVLEQWHDASKANIWNYAAPSEDGFFFTTMFSNVLTFREYDFQFNEIQAPVDIATADDLYIPNHRVADHATLRHGDKLYYAVSTDNDWNLVLISTNLEGERVPFLTTDSTCVQSTQIYCEGQSTMHKVNDPQLFSVDDDICVRWGEAGYEKSVRCFDTNLNYLGPTQTITTSIPTSQLGSTVWMGDRYLVFSGDETQVDLIVTEYSEDWEELGPHQTILESEYGEWNWASTGVAWIPEYGIWAIAYTNMPEDGGGMDGRGRIALFNEDFELLAIRFTQQQTQATFRTHLIWHGDYLIVSYDVGPVAIERWRIEEL